MEKQIILIVDDESINISVLVEILSEKYNLLVATNGVTALEIVKLHENIDLVLLDIVMPEMNGYEVARQLQPRDVPFIFLTVKSDPQSIFQGFQEGAVDYIPKPFAKEELLARIHNHLQLRKLNSELKAVKERLEYAIHGSNDGLWDWNIETSEVYFSPRWKEMLGYMDSELANTFETWEERVHLDDIQQAKNDVALCHSREGNLYSNIHRMRHKDGSWIWILSRGQSIFDAEGKAIRMVGFHTDITRQKELEKELFEQEEMIIAQSRNVAMGEMIGMIAHQWRQPITVIAMGVNNMLADIALESVEIDTFKHEAQQILHQTEYLSKTIEDFRTFFRPNKDKDEIKVIDIFQEARKIMGKTLENSNIDLVCVDNSNESILTYSRELLQVVLNLLKNAKEALEAKNIQDASIHVNIESFTDTIVTTVCDNGGGIDMNLLQRIFEPYFSTKDVKTGTGLGLYMSKIIIEKHLGGTLEAINRDMGACFIITLPKFFNGESENE